jgi:hypothetical protein
VTRIDVLLKLEIIVVLSEARNLPPPAAEIIPEFLLDRDVKAAVA